MADITFNGVSRIITVASGVTVIDAQTLYSWWKQWAATGDNSKYLQAFRPVGGDSIGGGALAPMYFFLLNGWKIRPYDADHVLTVSYNIYVDGGGNPYMATLGAHQVVVQSKVSDTPVYQLAGGSSLTAEEHNKLMTVPGAGDNADAVWEYER